MNRQVHTIALPTALNVFVKIWMHRLSSMRNTNSMRKLSPKMMILKSSLMKYRINMKQHSVMQICMLQTV